MLTELGTVTKHSWPYHPHTCGKIERFHQTLKRYFVSNGAGRVRCSSSDTKSTASSMPTTRSDHIARSATALRAKLSMIWPRPARAARWPKTHFWVRADEVGSCGKVTLRHDSKLFHIAIGRRWKGTKIGPASLTSTSGS